MLKNIKPTILIVTIALFNILLISIVIITWINPALQDIQIAQTSIRLQENRYAALLQNEAEFEANIAALAELKPENYRILPYEQLASTLAYITELAEQLELRESSFFIGEPILFGAVGENIKEVRGAMVYEGNFTNIYTFVHGLATMPGRVYEITLEFTAEATRLSFNISFFLI